MFMFWKRINGCALFSSMMLFSNYLFSAKSSACFLAGLFRTWVAKQPELLGWMIHFRDGSPTTW